MLLPPLQAAVGSAEAVELDCVVSNDAADWTLTIARDVDEDARDVVDGDDVDGDKAVEAEVVVKDDVGKEDEDT